MAEVGPQALLAAWELGQRQSPLDRAVTLLAFVTGGSREDAALTDLGTRDVLLARFLTALAGGTVEACATCRCGERLGLAVDVAMIGTWPTHPAGARLPVQIGERSVTVRLPTTADLRELHALDPPEAHRLLLTRCTGGLKYSQEDRDAELAAAIDEALEAASPAAVVSVLLECPACGVEWEAAVNLPALLWAELEQHARALLREVHELALAYGWSEPEILALPTGRRASYLQLVAT